MGASTQVVAATHLSTLSCIVLTLRTLSMLYLPKMKSTRMRRSPKIKYRPEKKKKKEGIVTGETSHHLSPQMAVAFLSDLGSKERHFEERQ